MSGRGPTSPSFVAPYLVQH